MNNLQLVQQNLNEVSTDFMKLSEIHGLVNFEKEASFSIQQLQNNRYLADIAKQNPDSFKFAILNIASIGLSLNPALNLAYLVPRMGKVVLDISYMGLIQLACESGAIKWVQAQLVYEHDEYLFNGIGEKPTHKFNAFKDRGELIGVYCLAKTEDSEFLVDQMSVNEVFSIRDRTDVYQKFKQGKIKSCPWVSDEGEMVKKTIIKRAFKLWPKNDKTKRLNQAIEVLNTNDGINFREETKLEPITDDQEKEIQELLTLLGRSRKQFIVYLSRAYGKEFFDINDLNINEAQKSIVILKDMMSKQEKREVVNENNNSN